MPKLSFHYLYYYNECKDRNFFVCKKIYYNLAKTHMDYANYYQWIA